MRKQKNGAPGTPTVDAVEQKPSNKTSQAATQPCTPWRERLPIHPAANEYPLLDQEELIQLGDNIKKSGLKYRAVVEETADGWRLCDGRNRLDAVEAVGLDVVFDESMFEKLPAGTNAEEYIASVNLFRRHLTIEKRRELIEELLIADPTKSDRQVAKETGFSNTHIGNVRKKLEKSGDVSTVDTRTDTKGRKQPAKKARKLAINPVDLRSAAPVELEPSAGLEDDKPTLDAVVVSQPSPSAPQPNDNWKAEARETVALVDFARFTLTLIKSGHLKVSADVSIPESEERYRKWKDLKSRVKELLQ
jgi:hypothetical protein